ncbi:HAD family hydrolase [Pseudomonas sp. FFUP_PS_473]|uniref:HAD family hydrolase n=1 Tax=Pseudomonas sp. FFUP_PS_473 TaxID=2060418 RepID=UPI000C7E688A|nr:HAD hydrolase-like protein [Pseudomonas sp. FFUP_PS_473]PLP89236.1 HAD family hydrolase [Pseudomonas sp. FFUP_PS_473]
MRLPKIDIRKYSSLIFDCDGVLLDSNRVKTEAFFNVAKQYGLDSAEKLVQYHVSNGGVSRYKKFDFFKRFILPLGNDAVIEEMLSEYAKNVEAGLMQCAVSEKLYELRELTKSANWLVVSGGDQEEIRRVFQERGISKFFDGGIFGSPDDKEKILEREIASRNISSCSVFLGDSKYDRVVAEKYNVDFIFVSEWSECKKEDFSDVLSVGQLSDLL